MSLYDDASLIMYPSGVKSGKIYSQKPTDGSGDLTFSRASTATRVNSSGLIEDVASGVPRIDYTGGGCGRLLLEPQRTNQLTYSEDFSNADWQKDNCTITGGQSDPVGSNNAYLLLEDTSNSIHRVISLNPFSYTSGTKYSASIFLKYHSRQYAMLIIGGLINDPNFNNRRIVVDVLNKTIKTDTSYESTAEITELADDWIRVSFVMKAPSSTVNNKFYVHPMINYTDVSYIGDNTKGVYIFGAQQEQGSYPTSYIPTSGAAVTRVKDASITSGLPISTTNNGTFYIKLSDFNVADTNESICVLSNSGTYLFSIVLNPDKSNIRIYSYVNSAFLTLAISIPTTIKIAISWQGTSVLSIYINGVDIGILGGVTFSSTFVVNKLELSTATGSTFKVSELITKDTLTSDAELESLTTI